MKENKPQSEEEDIVKQNQMSGDIQEILKSNGIDVDGDAFGKAFKEFQRLLGVVKANGKGEDESESEVEETDPEEKSPWKELKKKLEGAEDDAMAEDKKPKGVSITMIAIGKPKGKFMRDADEISKESDDDED